jgi:uncharacterized protein
MAISKELIGFLRSHFLLDWNGIHGANHWARVRFNGLLLARDTGADTEVLELFAFIHDAERQHDGIDRDHGKRAAALAEQLNGDYYSLSQQRLGWLMLACERHSMGDIHSDLSGHANRTITTCWDADRLDLGRVGIKPVANKLCNSRSQQSVLIEALYARSIGT